MDAELESLFQRVQLAAAMRDSIELAELRTELETLLESADDAEAVRARFEPLWTSDPANDASESAEALYERGAQAFAAQQHDAALGLWERAAAKAPEHFELRRRLGLVQRALQRHEDADASLERLLELYAHAEPPVSELLDALVDRFQLQGNLVTVHRRLAPMVGPMTYVWVFTLLADRTRRLATVQVESSDYGRERGVPYVLGMSMPAGHQLLDHSWTTLPPYLELRDLAAGYLSRALPA